MDKNSVYVLLRKVRVGGDVDFLGEGVGTRSGALMEIELSSV
jgi:hypothetical protein